MKDDKDYVKKTLQFSAIGLVATTTIGSGTAEGIGKSTSTCYNSLADIGHGDTLYGTSLLGTVGASIAGVPAILESSDAGDIIEVRTRDGNNYARTEIRAQQIYDKFHKGHNIEDKPSVLIADTPEKVEALEELLEMFDSKEELYIYLTALQRMVEEIIREEAQEESKQKILKKGNIKNG